MPTLGERFKNSWNAFLGRDPTKIDEYENYWVSGNSSRPDRSRLSRNNAKTIISSIYNRIAVDASMTKINHVKVDDDGNYMETINDSLNAVFTLSANLDQTGRALIRDAVMTMFDEGCVALVPTDTDKDPLITDSYKVEKVRVGKVIDWYPKMVRIDVYREDTGEHEQIVLPKRIVPIVENPFYATMNEQNSTSKRLLRVLNQLERTNENNSTSKLDMIIQLPYVIKSKARQVQAEERRKAIEDQLNGSQLGIAYIDGTERVTQLNRSLENNLWTQAKDLTMDLYNQLGLTQSIFDGTADEKTMLNYYDRTITPVLTAIVEEIIRKWLSPTARSQGHSIMFFNDPFRYVPVNQMAEISDKMIRNEIMTKNEMRSKIGLKPSDDPKADELLNPNINQPEEKIEEKEVIEE